MLPATRAEPWAQGGGGRESVDAQSSYTADTPWHKLEQFQGCCNLQQVTVVLGTELSPVQTEPPHISTRVLLLTGCGQRERRCQVLSASQSHQAQPPVRPRITLLELHEAI